MFMGFRVIDLFRIYVCIKSVLIELEIFRFIVVLNLSEWFLSIFIVIESE